jgi:ATP-dependent RNA helicase DHX37/DHR1
MRKEENLELLKKLAQGKVDTSLLRSSKTLGVVHETRRQLKSRVLKERSAGLNTAAYSERSEEESNDESDSDSGDDTPLNGRDLAPPPPPLKQAPPVQHNSGAALNNDVGLGSGLKRPLELDESGKPLIPKRRKKTTTVKSFTKPSPGVLNAQPSKTVSCLSEELAQATRVEADDVVGGADNGEEEEDDDDAKFSSSADVSDAESSAASEDGRGKLPKTVSSRISAFKAWAEQQRNEALGFKPSTVIDQARISQAVIPKSAANPRPNPKPDLPPSQPPSNVASRKAFAVYVDRSEETQAHRLELPVVMEEQKIMEAIHNNSAVILCGATGSGKTTQVPQFLYEAGYGNPESETPGIIGITQPRRVAAVSMAKRVAAELGDHADKVAYKVCINVRFQLGAPGF